MCVGDVRDNLVAAIEEHLGHRPGFGDHLLLVRLEAGIERFLERDGLGGDHVHQRSALDAGEYRRLEFLVEVFRLAFGQDDAAARAAQGFVRSEEHTSALQSLLRISYAVFCLNKQNMTHKSDTLITYQKQSRTDNQKHN